MEKRVSEIEDFGSSVTDLEGMRCREIDFNLMGCYVVSWFHLSLRFLIREVDLSLTIQWTKEEKVL